MVTSSSSYLVAPKYSKTSFRCSQTDNLRLRITVEHWMTENSDECNEAIGNFAEDWSERPELPEAIDGSTIDEFASANDGFATPGELKNKDTTADIVPSTSESGHEEKIDDPLPTSSEEIGALTLVQSMDMEGCGSRQCGEVHAVTGSEVSQAEEAISCEIKVVSST